MIQVEKLEKSYQRGVPVLRGITFTLPDTGFVCILGPSGCGKTSLLNAIGGLDRFDSGTLTAGDTTVRGYGKRSYENARNRNFGYIFQNYYLLEDHSVAYNVYLGLHSLDLTHREKLERVRKALQAVDMERFLRRKVRDLSGGQQQRIAIARALARRPRVIFADEPTGNLDESNTHNICALLRQVSKESLVVMVTHEESIANFYADRIITLREGQIQSDLDSWDRQPLVSRDEKRIYAGDLQEQCFQGEGLRLRLLRSENAPPVELTLVALGDKVILKTGEGPTAALSKAGEAPLILEGKAPVRTLEQVDGALDSDLFRLPPAPAAPAGKGLGFSMVFRQARMLAKGPKRRGGALFLALLTVLTLLTVGDFVFLSRVDPQDFILTDSHVLTVQLSTGAQVPEGQPPDSYTWETHFQMAYMEALRQLDQDWDLLGLYSRRPKFRLRVFHQLEEVELEMPSFSFVDLGRLPENSLLYGRLPENSQEVVVDRLLLEAVLGMEDVVAQSLQDITAFLGTQLHHGQMQLNPTVVGICDSGERSIYARTASRLSMAVRGVYAMELAELQRLYPGKYDDVVLEDGECIVNASTAGVVWKIRQGTNYGSTPNQRLAKLVIEEPELPAHIIMTPQGIENWLAGSMPDQISLYCADKNAAKQALDTILQGEMGQYLTATVTDRYQQRYDAYRQSASVRADGRTIVTATVLLLSAVMLYLLGRTRARERIGMLAVYRLLGIPKSKAVAVFAWESLLQALEVALPVGLVTWAVVAWGAGTAELAWPLALPWNVVGWTLAGIFVYHVLVSILPLGKLLRLPPAQLAAKFDL